jgi:ribonuclease Z
LLLGEGAVGGLVAVWVSHMHADHHSGLLAVLGARAAALRRARSGAPPPPPLAVAGPPPLAPLLAVYCALVGEEGAAVGAAPRAPPPPLARFIDAAAPGAEGALLHAAREALAALSSGPSPQRSLCPVLFRSIPVEHCRGAFGCAVGFEGASAARGASHLLACYSGDTRPCARLVEGCAGAWCALAARAAAAGAPPPAALLVHEATFLSSRAAEAARKRHSTVSEAVGVGGALDAALARAGGALSVLVLTHFSQRYAAAGDVGALERARRGGAEAGAAAAAGAGEEAAAEAAAEAAGEEEEEEEEEEREARAAAAQRTAGEGRAFPVLCAADFLRIQL